MSIRTALVHMAATKVDGCPRCVRRNNAPLSGVVAADERGVVCRYRCRGCGHRWVTSWGAWFAANSLDDAA